MIQIVKEDFKGGKLSKPQFIDAMSKQHELLFDYVSLLQTVDISSIEITPDAVVFTTKKDGIKFNCRQADKRAAPFEILNFGEYESEDADLLYQLISNGNTIFDIGANIGWYSLVFSKKFPESIIHSFEPLPSTYRSLTANLALNKVERVTSNNFGFSNEAKTLKFYSSASTSVSSSSQNITEDENAIETICEVITLDSYVAEKNLAIDIIKCDVEGAELFVYQGGMQTLEKYKPMVFTEMLRKWSAKFGYHPNDIISLFARYGYQCFYNNGNNRLALINEINETTSKTNFFFLHPVKHAAILNSFEAK